MRIFENADFTFIDNRRKGYVFSAILLFISVGALVTRGLELGIDFQGGMEFVVESPTQLNPVQVRGALANALGQEPEVKTFDEVNQLLIRTSVQGEISQIQNQIISGIENAFPD